MSEFRPLFPQFLEMGAKEAAAVMQLQHWLILLGHNRGGIIPDGDFGEQTAIGVGLWQEKLGVTRDRKFGPETRQAIKDQTGLDVNAIPA